jgi:hypothetical protein
MKRFLFPIIFVLVAVSSLSATPSFSVSIGGDFFNYEKAYLDMGASGVFPIKNGMEINFGVNVGIATRTVDSNTEATFYVPFDLGLNFVFNENSKLNFLIGTGITPQFLFENGTSFYMGPYLKGGIRVQVHEYMKLFFELQQDLIIGAPHWINTTTSVRTGILFSLGSNK